MIRPLRDYLSRHGIGPSGWSGAKRVPDAEGRFISGKARPAWADLAIAETSDLSRGISADQATDLAARSLLRDRRFLRGASVCEAGCGTGVLSILASRLGARRVMGIDCDPKALLLARRAVSANAVPVELRRGDLLTGIRDRFDILLANLPQKPAPRGLGLGPRQDGGACGDAVLRRFLPQAARRLEPEGRLHLFLHTLVSPRVLAQASGRFRVEVVFWRRRHVAPGEFPAECLETWLSLARRGRALFHPRPDRPGWHTFYAMQLVARRR